MKLVLWTLNRVASWDLGALASALSDRRHQVRLGSRQRHNRDGAPSKAGVLSHEEGDGFDEYFVPIPVKCLGDPAMFRSDFEGQMKEDGPALLQRILHAYPEHFEPGDKPRFHTYWTPGDGTEMFTRHWVGFYQLLASDLQPGEKAVLVGYSQGGLVARFLAFLDEHLMRPEQRKIAGFITVQSPNAGSPLANSRNGDRVALGLFAMLSGAAGYPIPPCGTYTRLGEAQTQLAGGELKMADGPRHFDIGAVCGLVDAALADAKAKLREAESSSSPELEMARAKVEVLGTARRWLSGVQPLPGYVTAFADLSTATLDVTDSVLNLLARSPFQATYHGAIVGTDNQLSDFISSGLPWYVRLGLRFFKGLQAPVQRAEVAYAQIAMDERAVLDKLRLPGALEAANRYWNGHGSMPPRAHDFVIPSASQVLPEGPRPFFLGNAVNPKGTHISGGSASDADSDRPFVTRMLAEMGKRLEA